MSGPELYLEKPVNPENYIAAVKKLLGMEVSEIEAKTIEKVKIQNEIKNLLDNAELSDLEKIKRLLREK
jgi:hypothetical protein